MQKSLTYLLYLIHPPQKLVINVQGKQVQVRVLGAIKTLGGNITQKSPQLQNINSENIPADMDANPDGISDNFLVCCHQCMCLSARLYNFIHLNQTPISGAFHIKSIHF